jgi:putative cardiolipin synthase
MVPAHSGYISSRKFLLGHGVELHEAKPDTSFDQAGRKDTDLTQSAIHMKVFVLDRRFAFIGSFNWDPRSALINTELVYFIDSPELAKWLAEKFEDRLSTKSYTVRLNEQDEVEWFEQSDTGPVIYSDEPHTSMIRRFKAQLYRTLPLEEQL